MKRTSMQQLGFEAVIILQSIIALILNMYKSVPNSAPVIPDPVYFVRMCFSFVGEYKKLLAYALGAMWRVLGS
jgi:hypothetical protein